MTPVKKVFLVIGMLVLAFLIWQLVFNDGGILVTWYNAFADLINGVWQKITGNSTSKIFPEWKSAVGNKNGEGLNNAQW